MTSLPTGLPHGWEVRHSNSKNLPYYFNPSTRESRWEPPTDTDSERLKVYMGAYHSSTLQATGGGGSSSNDANQGANIFAVENGGSAAAAAAAAANGTSSSSNAGKIRASHLLVKHRESRRPASWRQANITRSKDEARRIIEQHEQRIKSGEVRLGDLAVQESDCSSARKRGDLGFFGRGDMQKEFEEAAFALKPGEISTVVETASGLHLIERLE